MLTEAQKKTLKTALLKMKEQASKRTEETNPKASMQEMSGELSMYDNHPADMATALYEREKDLTLHEQAESEMGKVEIALKAMEEYTYGKCEVCGKPIPFERLQIVPYSTLCVTHAKSMEQSVEEDVARNAQQNPFEATSNPKSIDYLNSFQEVAEFGTSDSPSDFTDSENPTYFIEKDARTSAIDEVVGKSVTDHTEE